MISVIDLHGLLLMNFAGVRLDRVRGGRQKYKRSPDSQVIVVHQQLHHSRQQNNHQSSQQQQSQQQQQQHTPYQQIIAPAKKFCTEGKFSSLQARTYLKMW